MIKIDTENPKGVYVELEGTTTDISVEYAAVGRSIFRTLKKDNPIAGMMFMMNVMKCFDGIIREDMAEMEKEHPFLKNDICRSEFDSDEEFMNWFRGGDDDEEGSED